MYTYCFVDRENAHSIWSLIDVIAERIIESGNRVVYCRFCDRPERVNRNVPKGVQVKDIVVPTKCSSLDLIKQHRVFNKAFRGILRQESVDIVHTHFVLPGAMARWMARRENIPAVITTHHELYGSMSSHWRWALRMTQYSCNAAVYISDQVKSSFSPLVGRAQRDTVIKNGVDIEGLVKYKAPTSQDITAPSVICPGRFVSVKGQATLVEAWPKVLERFPEATLCFPGEGPDGEQLKTRCQVLGISEAVEFPGWLSRDASLKRVSAASVMVVPSTQEGFGLVVAEAMALETPLVCSDIPVFREVAADTACYFPVGNADALAEAIIRTLSYPKQAKELAAQASLRVAEHFDQRDMVAAYLQLYDDLLVGR